MTITVNGQEHTFSESNTVLDVLTQLNQHDQGGIAVALNDCVVPKSNWNNSQLSDGDKILIIKASQGG
ncbi:sulfur carrier protein ThiS [Carboxylicivirga linearis]|uniref:Sulfur carrier protein ThiS n=1 Tax=Carboxylicivirga linearis TaxID=1628157 RepID=A0ABS5JYP7_9BACT|nr:sulfur carrier protein ThiS [Carboxylicivirga linearis]MBS2099920.1 sulfur carrier protein ThiS [Carboxylicivirga linearis]